MNEKRTEPGVVIGESVEAELGLPTASIVGLAPKLRYKSKRSSLSTRSKSKAQTNGPFRKRGKYAQGVRLQNIAAARKARGLGMLFRFVVLVHDCERRLYHYWPGTNMSVMTPDLASAELCVHAYDWFVQAMKYEGPEKVIARLRSVAQELPAPKPRKSQVLPANVPLDNQSEVIHSSAAASSTK